MHYLKNIDNLSYFH